MFKLSILILVKYWAINTWIFCFKPSRLSEVICSNIKALKLAPNVGFKYLSGWLVKKKLIKLYIQK